jgi:hypothetical protein
METFRYRELIVGKMDMKVPMRKVGRVCCDIDPAGAVYDIDAREAEADRETLIDLLKRGKLMPSDLVFSQGRWQTFSQAPEFYEACEGLWDSRASDQKVTAVVYGLLFIAIVYGIQLAVPIWLGWR